MCWKSKVTALYSDMNWPQLDWKGLYWVQVNTSVNWFFFLAPQNTHTLYGCIILLLLLWSTFVVHTLELLFLNALKINTDWSGLQWLKLIFSYSTKVILETTLWILFLSQTSDRQYTLDAGQKQSSELGFSVSHMITGEKFNIQ